jgi:hypothetical protein
VGRRGVAEMRGKMAEAGVDAAESAR